MLIEKVHLVHLGKFRKNFFDLLSWRLFRAYFNKFYVILFHLSFCKLFVNSPWVSEVHFVADNDCRNFSIKLMVLNLLNFLQKKIKRILVVNRINENVPVLISSPNCFHRTYILLACSIMNKNLKFYVVDVQNWALLTLQRHVMALSKLILDEASDDVGFSNFFRPKNDIRIGFVYILSFFEFIRIDWLVQWH